MSCLTDLEKALGIEPVDLNFESVEFNVNSEKKPKRNEVDYSTSTFQETKNDSNYTPEFSSSKLNFGDYSPLCSKKAFDPVKTGALLNIGTARATSLYLQLQDTIKYGNAQQKSVANQILTGLIDEKLNRTQINDLIGELVRCSN